MKACVHIFYMPVSSHYLILMDSGACASSLWGGDTSSVKARARLWEGCPISQFHSTSLYVQQPW